MATTKLDHSEALFERDRPTWIESLLDVVRQLRFGSVEITVHDGRIVQIERKEKLRFETPASSKGR
ncbi:MAG: YezD family protein [Pseudomonadota bacterium]|nr:YezD family protein [Pseudomonadota bacterium]